ncbi:cation:proton antiporter [Halosimplex pelagicum]|uniref:Cation:proton antiporter n=1 Tax=Halosimplex pelagicum TaxID=869886 RepID=A0A7D5TCK4_9EURY|nr:cation:proton antiporter [Halosimplex pelagicum]QLH83193.1 cation:proton antiporter [Halosimplex pelagicum]
MSEALVEVGIALAALAAVGYVAHRVSLSVIPAYIVAAIVVGPHEPTSVLGVSLTLVPETEFIDVLAELGVVLLLFFLGLEFSVDKLLADRRRILAAGTVDLALNFGVGIAIGLAFGLGAVPTLFVAGVVYISSSAIVTKSLIEEGWIANAESGPILGTLVYEDLFIAVYLAVLAALVAGSGDVAAVARDVGVAFAFLAVLAVGAWGGTAVLDRAFDLDSDELFLMGVLATTTLVAGAALTLGLSEAVAAFFVGAAFSQTDHVDRIEHLIAPVRDLFAAFFFFSIGLTIDVTVVTTVAGLLGAAVVCSTVTKVVSGTVSGRFYDLSPLRSLRTGIGLVPRGEFSLVIAALAVSAPEPVSTVIPPFAVGYVLVMSVVGTVLIQHSDRVTDALVPYVPGSG